MTQDTADASRFGVSDTYWMSLTDADRALYRRIRPLRKAVYAVQTPILRIEKTLDGLDSDARSQGGQLQLCPDFQRGHVWTQAKQIAFVEAVIRGTAPLNIRFNSPGWDGRQGETEGLNPYDIQCVDGLQRLTALREFVAGEFAVFNGLRVHDLDNTSFSFQRMGMMWTLEMFSIASRAELLQFYLDLNSGGVVHSGEELARVESMLRQAGGTRQS